MEGTYTLLKGTILYRGDTPYYLENKETLTPLQNKPTFFALNPDDVPKL
jgi:hypothetical protein